MGSSRRLPRAARRAQLIEAAAAAFLEGGYETTSMEDVAQRAGVSRLIVYRNFESKADLYRSVLGSVLMELGQSFEGVSADVVRARGAVTVILPVARRHPDAFRLMWRHSVNQPEFASFGELFRTATETYARAILRNYVSDPVALDWVTRAAASHLGDGVCLWLDLGDPTRDDEFAGMMTAGLRAMAVGWAEVTDVPVA